MNSRYHSRYAHHAGDAPHSGRSSPAFSNLSDIENDTTDDFGKRMIQDAKDSQRLRHALRRPNTSVQSQRRPGLTAYNLSRQNRREPIPTTTSAHPEGPHYGSPGSAASGSSVASEPSVRIPREWGRKGRQQPDWLRRRIQPDDAERLGGLEDVSNVFQSRGVRSSGHAGLKDTPNIDWAAAAADVPLPSVEESPLASRHSTPAAGPNNDSLDRIRDLEMSEEFSVASLLQSTPAAVTRNTALDEIRVREFQNIKNRPTVAKTERPRHAFSPERRRNDLRTRMSASTSPDKHQSTGHVASSPPKWAETSIRDFGSTTITQHTTPAADQTKVEDEPQQTLPKSPVVVYNASDARAPSVGRVAHGAKRPDHKREDSHDTLRRLARVTSMSPSPSNTPEADQPATRQPNNIISDSRSPKREPSKPAIVGGHSKRPSLATPKVNADDQSSGRPSTTDVKTPKVSTGGWVDTPRAEIADHLTWRPHSRESRSGEVKSAPATQQKLSSSTSTSVSTAVPRKPNLPRSALSAVIAHANGDASHRDFGDSTIDSLESLITSPTLPSFDAGSTNPPILSRDQRADDTNRMADRATVREGYPNAQARRAGEIEALQSMNERLRLARTSIRDARRGVSKIEAKVDGMDDHHDHGDDDDWSTDESVSSAGSDERTAVRRRTALKNASQSRSRSSRRFRTSHHHHCRCCREGWFEKNFRKFRRAFWRNGHWTWLGWLWWGFVIWVIVETILCSIYCRAEYATYMVDYGIDPYAPEMPYVTCTVFYRKLLKPFSFIYWPVWVFSREAIKTTYRFVTGTEFPWGMLTRKELEVQWREERAAQNAMSQESSFNAATHDAEDVKMLKDVIWSLARWGRGAADTGAIGSATKLGNIDDIGVLGQDEVL